MRIRSIRVLSGPNYWSIRRHKLIQMRLDLEDLQERPTNTIPGFKERLEALLPGLWEHQCSRGCYGGFLQRVEEGTLMGHVVEHVALELQTLAGMKVDFGRTRETSTPAPTTSCSSIKRQRPGALRPKLQSTSVRLWWMEKTTAAT